MLAGIGTGEALRQLTAALHLQASMRPALLYPQIAENVRVKDRQIVSCPTFLNAVAAARAKLGDAARLVVRPSGTEPLVRIFLEGQDTDRLNAVAQELKHILVSSCGQGEE